jgi:ribonuclease D
VKYDYLSTDEALREFCRDIDPAALIALDTEFVSEDRYFPDLCLVQVAVQGRFALIDPLAVDDLTPFWQALLQPERVSIVHAGREEFRFCRRATGQRPAQWFDTQIAAGLTGVDYPAAYATLIHRYLGTSLGKGETRTNWRRRPLSKRQLEYAVQDVVYLQPLYESISHRLDALHRRSWLAEELAAWQDQMEAEEQTERWRRVSGITGLSSRQLAVLHALWRWRDGKARAQNVPPRQVLRDDLMVELARRGSADPQQIRAVRGMDWRKQQRAIPELAQCVRRALDLPDDQCPDSGRKSSRPPFNVLGQFLATAVSSVAQSAQVAPGLVGSVQDVRDLIAYHLGWEGTRIPVLATGWRKEVVGDAVNQLLDGKLAIRITDPTSHHPLAFERLPERDADAAHRRAGVG